MTVRQLLDGYILVSYSDLVQQHRLNPTNGLLVYTDGAYSPKGPGGWAWVGVDGFNGVWFDSGFVPPPTTNNRMEMQAQMYALRELHNLHGPCEIEVVSDSAYVVLGCQFPERKRNVNNDLWEELDRLVNLHIHVQWRHVRGHKQVKFNELADELAVKAKKEAKW